MVDPHSAVAGTNALLSVCIFIGSQLSPSVMIRRAVKKELKVAALLTSELPKNAVHAEAAPTARHSTSSVSAGQQQ
ncbi:hypothetical protein L227DRAFT_582127 [Lentinus tigrinus ALCF2SS1-6]|uniref:Uncharacterized protein n=1 Tax=Lentinus tigrinus ALCF2SS1-6 TaxID=1328759 RepID=A0A5C2RP99_9APHY|nr:hypothetical protein L227DRAFT_582127 [Lentinus tigrinus ALCF2SS1-6]